MFDEPYQMHPDGETPINDLPQTIDPVKYWVGEDKVIVERHVILSEREAEIENGDVMADGSDSQGWDKEIK